MSAVNIGCAFSRPNGAPIARVAALSPACELLVAVSDTDTLKA